jgi:hypothetical protein
MTAEEVKLVQDSFAKIVPIGGTVADLFYDRCSVSRPTCDRCFLSTCHRRKRRS